MFLRVAMRDGNTYISEFSKLGKVQRYVSQVFRGEKPFNVWRVVNTTHPVTGEPFLTRTRTMVNGAEVVNVTQVQRKADAAADSFSPTDFEQVPVAERMPVFTVPQEGISGQVTNEDGTLGESYSLQTGADYPIHRDAGSLRRFVYARYDATNPIKHYLDGPMAGSSAFSDNEQDDDNLFESDEDEF